MLQFEAKILQKMLDDTVRTFPDEACGFLLGRENGEERVFYDILVVENSKEGDKRRRFEISARDYLNAEQFALQKGLDLLGVYHSHPKHPAIPSEHDRVAAMPYFSYVIVSVFEHGPEHLRSWRLNEAQQFEEEAVDIAFHATI